MLTGRPLPLWLLASVASDVLILDQLTKWLVRKHLPLHTLKPILPVFNLTHVQNTGAAFGVGQNSGAFFIVLTLTILGVLAYLHRRIAAQGRPTALGLALVWGGALGNLADRVKIGAVTDFLDFHWSAWHWPAFNVADSAISVGVALMFLDGLRKPSPPGPEA